jgi:DNA invertase Pin-like site-specific DNA recombinase
MTKAWMFLRRSTDKQDLSLQDQEAECKAYAKKNDLTIVRTFTPEKGYGSGLTIDADSQFQAMVRLAEQRIEDVKFLIVYDVSRFGRLAPERKIYWEQHFARHGITVRYAKDEFRNDGSLGDGLSQYVKHSEAHEYSKKLSEVTLRGAKSHTLLGHFAGGSPPYGYDRQLITNDGTPIQILKKGQHKAEKTQHTVLVPSETAAPIVVEMFTRYAKLEGLKKIAGDLNSRGITAPRKKFWNKGQVRHILQNRAYLGILTYNKTSFKRFRRKERGSLLNTKDQWVVKEGAHEPIIGQELFDKVQSLFKKRPFANGRGYGSSHLLTNLTICNHCGSHFNGSTKVKNGNAKRYYTCSGYHRSGAVVCRSVHVAGDELEGEALNSIKNLLQGEKWEALVRERVTEKIKALFPTSGPDRGTIIKKQLSSIENEISNIVGAIKNGFASASLKEALIALEAQKEGLNGELAQFKQQRQFDGNKDKIVDEILALRDDLDDLWNNCANYEERKSFLKTFIYQVNIHHDEESVDAYYYLYTIPALKISCPETLFPVSRGFYPLSLLRGPGVNQVDQAT